MGLSLEILLVIDCHYRLEQGYRQFISGERQEILFTSIFKDVALFMSQNDQKHQQDSKVFSDSTLPHTISSSPV